MKEGKIEKRHKKVRLKCTTILRQREGLPAAVLHFLPRSVTTSDSHLTLNFTQHRVAIDKWGKMKYVLWSPINILQRSTSSSGIYDSTASRFKRKTEMTDFIFMLIIKERCNL